MKIFFITLQFLIMQGCNLNCDNIIEKTYYDNGIIKTILTKDCKDNIVKYEHFNLGNELGFRMYYWNSIPDKSFYGAPWINLIWNKENYKIGDTLLLEIEIATPPELQMFFSLKDNDSIKQYNSSKIYKYKKILKDSILNIQLIADFSFNNKKWITARRSIEINMIHYPPPLIVVCNYD